MPLLQRRLRIARCQQGLTLDRREPFAEQETTAQRLGRLMGRAPVFERARVIAEETMREVRQAVERARSENPGSSVVIVADKGSRIGMVTQVMDQVRKAGVSNVSIAATPGE